MKVAPKAAKGTPMFVQEVKRFIRMFVISAPLFGLAFYAYHMSHSPSYRGDAIEVGIIGALYGGWIPYALYSAFRIIRWAFIR